MRQRSAALGVLLDQALDVTGNAAIFGCRAPFGLPLERRLDPYHQNCGFQFGHWAIILDVMGLYIPFRSEAGGARFQPMARLASRVILEALALARHLTGASILTARGGRAGILFI